MRKKPEIYLAHMLEHGRRILDYTASGRGAFLNTPMMQDAVIRNFEVIGEAASRIPAEFRERYRRSAGPPWSVSGTSSSTATPR